MTPFDLACDAVDVRDALVCLVRARIDLQRLQWGMGNVVFPNVETAIAANVTWEAVEAAADLLDTLEEVLGCS